MKWIKWTQPGAVLQQYHLVEGKTLLETVRYQPLQQSVRICFADQQRVFFIKDTAKKMSGYAIENEYGFCEGTIKAEGTTRNEMVCSISIGQHQLHFSLHHPHSPQAELVSVHPAHPQSGLICGLPAEPAATRLHRVTAISLTHLHAALVWSLHWWLFMGKPTNETAGNLPLSLRSVNILVH